MSRSHFVVVLGTALWLLIVSSVLAEDKPSAKKPAPSSANDPFAIGHKKPPQSSATKALPSRTGEKAIEEALASQTQMEFHETPLSDVIDYLKNYHHIEIQLDIKALDDVGIGTDTPVTTNLKGISLRSALNLMLRELNLTWTIQDEVLLITTPEEAESRMITKVLDVSDLVVCRDKDDELWDDYDTLIDTINSSIMLNTWDAVGGPGSITGASLGAAKVLVVSQSYEGQRQIADLLARIRAVAKKNPDEEPPQRDKPPFESARIAPGAHQRILKLLADIRAIAKEFPEKEPSATPKPSKKPGGTGGGMGMF